MSIENRLNKLEGAAVTLPRSVAQLMRDYEAQPAGSDRAWLANLSDDELALLCAEADRQLPHMDFSQFTDAELDRIVDMNAEEIGQLVAGDFSPLKGAQ